MRRRQRWLRRSAPAVPGRVAMRLCAGRNALKFLDHLEEWLIAFLMGAATLLIFVAVVHRYLAGLPIPGAAGPAARDRPVVGAGAVHLHVRVDGEVRRRLRRAHRHPRRRRRDDQPAAAVHAQGVRAVRPAGRRHVHGHRRHAGRHVRLGHRATRARCRPTSRCRSGSSTCASRSARTSCASASCRSRGRSSAPASCRTTTSRTSRASRSRSTRTQMDDNLHPADLRTGGPR